MKFTRRSLCLSVVVASLVLFLADASLADCPDTDFICPTGQNFEIGSSFNWAHAQCETNGSVLGVAMKNCPNHCGPDWSGRADGCSIPVKGLKEMWNEVFHAACDLHDLCYSSTGHNQADCDTWFYKNMVSICHLPGSGSLLYPQCVSSATIIYEALDKFGSPHFKSNQKWATSHCSE